MEKLGNVISSGKSFLAQQNGFLERVSRHLISKLVCTQTTYKLIWLIKTHTQNKANTNNSSSLKTATVHQIKRQQN